METTPFFIFNAVPTTIRFTITRVIGNYVTPVFKPIVLQNLL